LAQIAKKRNWGEKWRGDAGIADEAGGNGHFFLLEAAEEASSSFFGGAFIANFSSWVWMTNELWATI
jgi:hypothetical protein